jgi:predicted nucleic acid-binding protein
MELLGCPGITAAEEQLIVDGPSKFTYRAITIEVEDEAIALRRARKVKCPDAIIAATAIHHGLELLTFDVALLSIVRSVSGSGA